MQLPIFIVFVVFRFVIASAGDCTVPLINNGLILEKTLGPRRWKYLNFRYERDEVNVPVPHGSTPSQSASLYLSCSEGYSFQGKGDVSVPFRCSQGRWSIDPVCLHDGTKDKVSTQAPRSILEKNHKTENTTTRTTTLQPHILPTTSVPLKVDCTVPVINNGVVLEKKLGPPKWKSLKFRYESDEIYVLVPHGSTPSQSASLYLSCYGGYSIQGKGAVNMPIHCWRGQWSIDPVCLHDGTIYKVSTQAPRSILEKNHKTENTTTSTTTLQPPILPTTSVPLKENKAECTEIETRGIYFIDYSNRRKVNSVAIYYCRKQTQMIVGVNNRTCLPTGEWSGQEPTCIDTTCPVFIVTNGLQVTYSEGNRPGSFALFHCQSNATLVGTAISVCRCNGSWSTLKPTCQKQAIHCPLIEEKGIFNVVYSDDRKLNSTALFSCKDSKQNIAGTDTLTCSKNGQWSGTEPSCNEQEIRCPLIEEKGIFNVLYSDNRKMNSTAVFSCRNSNQNIAGTGTLTCSRNGRWSGTEPSCQGVRGCLLDIDSGSSQMIIKPKKQHFNVGEFASFSCPDGYSLNSETVRVMCMGRSWSNPFPECVKDVVDTESTEKNE